MSDSGVVWLQKRIREAKDELTAEVRINTERTNQMTALLREQKQFERDLDARQKNLVSRPITVCSQYIAWQCLRFLCMGRSSINELQREAQR